MDRFIQRQPLATEADDGSLSKGRPGALQSSERLDRFGRGRGGFLDFNRIYFLILNEQEINFPAVFVAIVIDPRFQSPVPLTLE